MRIILFIAILGIVTGETFAQSPVAAMFRSPVASSQPPGQYTFDVKEWRFFAGSPVRSSVLVWKDLLYFGTAGGDFLAITKTGELKWKFHSAYPVHSSAAATGHRVFVSDNQQVLRCFDDRSGRKIWERALGKPRDYPWRFDYYYSSPILHGGNIYIGGSDGLVYCIEQETGRIRWTFAAAGLVRGSAAIDGEVLYIGDTEGYLYALQLRDGHERWHFRTHGSDMNLEEFGFDRKAILATPVVAGERIIVGARDGFLYCLDRSGRPLWEADHKVSWIVSTVAVKDSFVVTGTSDGRFVQAVDLVTGRERWKFRPNTLFWSSPLIVGDKVYAAGFDGILYALDLRTGKRIGCFSTGDKIFSSPVWDGERMYIGSDDGYVYGLKGHPDPAGPYADQKRFVYHEPGVNPYFRNGADLRVKNFLVNNGYTSVGADTLESILSTSTAAKTVLVLASCYLPPAVSRRGDRSILREFLNNGGRIVLPGTNPLIYGYDPVTRQPNAFAITQADTILSIHYGPNDTRAMGGQFPCFSTEQGKRFGLPDFWNASLFLEPAQVDVVLGTNENGKVSAFVKKIGKGMFVQCYLHPELPQQLESLTRLAEWNMEERK